MISYKEASRIFFKDEWINFEWDFSNIFQSSVNLYVTVNVLKAVNVDKN
jgi:hypothetical protein